MRILFDNLIYKPQTAFKRFNPFEKRKDIKPIIREHTEIKR